MQLRLDYLRTAIKGQIILELFETNLDKTKFGLELFTAYLN